MKKALAIVLLICLLIPATAAADGLLPDLTEIYGIDMPSMSAALRRVPDEETVLDDGSIRQRYSGVKEYDFDIFGKYAEEHGCSMGEYTVKDGILDAAVEKQGASFSLLYDSNEETAVLIYPAETDAEPAKNTRYLPDNTGYLPEQETLFFGCYEQDNDPKNGTEFIEWIVLEDDGEKKLLLSKYALDCIPYNNRYIHVTWERSSLRTWLNSTFLNKAFSPNEQKRIVSETVTADFNPKWDTSPGNDTTDKVFLLSIDEANRLFPNNDARKCAPTDYAVAHGSGVSKVMAGDRAASWWRLRTPGSTPNYAALVVATGSIAESGRNVNAEYAIRPALWLKY